MTTLPIGANGQLGSELRKVFGDQDLASLTHATLESVDRVRVDAVPNYTVIGAAHQPNPISNRVRNGRTEQGITQAG